MNLDSITTKGWILALFIRDDGERFLLGDGWYDFKDSLQHFQPNTFANDIVELQGTDGQLLAGQVRRSASQAFDGYVGDALTSKADIEQRRRDFLMFFRKKHFYKVIYIFCDGSAIQRDRGYIVDAPSVPEMWQKFPSYHVALAFEQVNYYEYAEDEDGKEIFAHMADINVSTIMAGGLVWDEDGAVSEDIGWTSPIELSGTTITINDVIEDAPMTVVKLEGNATQQTYSGANIFNRTTGTEDVGLIWANGNTTSNTNAVASDYIAVSANEKINMNYKAQICFYNSSKTYLGALQSDGTYAKSQGAIKDNFTVTNDNSIAYVRLAFRPVNNNNENMKTKNDIMVNKGDSLLPYQPYVGETPAPNPAYPQAIQTVTGKQTVSITDGNSTQTFDIDLNGSNIFTGNIAQFDDTGGTGTTYTYFKLPDQKNYILKLTAKNNISAQNPAKYLGFTANGGNASGGYEWAWYGTTLTAQAGDVFLVQNGTYDCVSLYPKNDETLQWFMTNFDVELYPTIGLLKTGTYEDYIWNDNGTWKIHHAIKKAIATVLWSTRASNFDSTNTARYQFTNFMASDPPAVTTEGLCEYFALNPSIYSTDVEGFGFSASHLWFRGNKSTIGSDSSAVYSWFSAHPQTIYYPLETPTEETITDATLISQLETISQLYEGDNTITITPASGATGTLTIEYMSEQSFTQGYVWESGGTGGLTTVDVSSVDAVQPIWTVEGPATNPTLTNITSSQTLTWNSTVPSGQTLIVDIANQTATMEGANVYAFLSGDWVELRPGANRISYSVTGTDQPSTLSWNNIVG